jgi:inorganic phosphate transporter, PiT family
VVVAYERFSCAPGPAGRRYNAQVLASDERTRTGLVDVTIDASGRQIRVEVRAGDWIVSGGVVGGETVRFEKGHPARTRATQRLQGADPEHVYLRQLAGYDHARWVGGSGLVDAAFVLAVVAALAFAFTNGFHDAANAIATLVVTRGASPGAAIALAAVCNLLGPLLLGAAVANTIATIVAVPQAETVEVVGAALTAAVTWNVITWRRGLPSSSSHALVGGLVGAGVVEAGIGAINWGGIGGGHPTGVIGVLIALAVSPVLGFGASWAVERGARRGLRRATTRVNPLLLRSQWPTSALLAFSHGANDAQKSVGVLAVILLAHGTTQSLSAPVWTKAACAVALTAGTALGGWPIVRTIGRRLFRIRPVDGLISQTSSAAVIFSASLLGAPASTSQVVAASVVGVGGGRHRYRHVGWKIVGSILLAWVTTLPAAAFLAALFLVPWRWLA